MTRDFSTWSGVQGDVVSSGLNVGSFSFGVILKALELPVEEDGRVDLSEFEDRVRRAWDAWGPESPGWPSAEYREAYNFKPVTYEYYFDDLLAMCRAGRTQDHLYVIWQ